MMSTMGHSEEVKRLQIEVEKAKMHLAEVVDECVFVEGEKRKVEEQLAEAIQLKDVAELLRVLESLTAYVLNLEQLVIAPALGALDDGMKQFSTPRAEALATIEHMAETSSAISGNALSPLMSRVYAGMRQGPNFASATLRRQQIVSGPPLLSLDDAYVMCVSMVAAKQQLQANIADVQRGWDSCAAKLKLGTVSTAAASSAALNAANQNLSGAKAQIASMAQSIRLLEDAANGNGNGGEVVRVTQRLRELEQHIAQQELERGEVAQRFATLQAALEAAHEPAKDVVPRSTHDLVLLQAQHQAKTVQELQNELSAVRKELRDSRKEWEESRRQLDGTIDALRAQLAERQKESHLDDMDAFIRSLQRGGGASSSNGGTTGSSERESAQQYQTKIRAFEMTISALNSELALLEDKIIAIERRSEDEKREAGSVLGEVKKKHKDEVEECETVVQRLTTELESLIHENGELKQKLRNAYSIGR